MLHTIDPFAAIKPLDVSRFASLTPQGAPVDSTTDANVMIDAGRTLRRKVERRRFVTVRNSKRAAEQIGRRLPGRGEVIHMLLRANAWACYDALPAIISLAGRPATEVILC